MEEKTHNTNNSECATNHSNKSGNNPISEINSRTEVFNIQSSKSKPYDTNNMVKSSDSSESKNNK